ncbi:hypothetical protein BpHYR1_010764 [Brachionus plicatilis]|uniref:Uncharacterized protein n=1 Tax=Brachionus plicatilis TaxID=10195 RepID=A0A3M7QM41_BRAPC|nr:hypothetical protein BpHYR1_010764 [Brachionus plicatilis]
MNPVIHRTNDQLRKIAARLSRNKPCIKKNLNILNFLFILRHILLNFSFCSCFQFPFSAFK